MKTFEMDKVAEKLGNVITTLTIAFEDESPFMPKTEAVAKAISCLEELKAFMKEKADEHFEEMKVQ